MHFRFLAFGALVLAASIGSAQLYSQLPDPNGEGGAFSDSGQTIADNFTTSTSAPVTHITFWGSFFGAGNPFPGGGSRNVSVSFMNDDGFGLPGSVIGQETGAASFVPTGLLTNFGGAPDTVYQFDIDWTGPAFSPTAGTQYWLSIFDTESTDSFRWHNGLTGDDRTSVSFDGGTTWGPDLSRPNAAFVLNPVPVPEPASMAALGMGALALLRRRRKG